jgi:hypothetical protein
MGRKKKIRPEKECPRCGTLHIKRGVYCSYSCANVRDHSEEDKLNKSVAVAAYHKTEESEEHKWKLSHIARAARQYQTDSTVVMPTLEDMEPPLPPQEYEEQYRSRVSGRDVWFDVD